MIKPYVKIKDSNICTIREKLTASNGFTLIEFLVTMSIIGIGLSLAVPNYSHTTTRSDIRVAIQTITQSIQLGRQLAQTNNSISSMVFEGNTIEISVLSDPDYKKYVYLPAKVMLDKTSSLNFLPTGILNEGEGSFDISYASSADITGKIKYSIMGFVQKTKIKDSRDKQHGDDHD